MRIWKFLFTSTRVFKHKEVVSNLHVCSNGLGKFDFHIHFTFLQEFYNPHKRLDLFFFSHNICRDIKQSIFSSRKYQNDLPNTQVLGFPSKLLLGTDMFTLTLVDLEYESSVSIW